MQLQSVLPEGSLGLTKAWRERDEAFFKGMEADAGDPDHGLKDPMELWEKEYKGKQVDGLILIGGSSKRSNKMLSLLIQSCFGSSISIIKTETGEVRKGKFKDREQ